MAGEDGLASELAAAVEAEDWDRIEELWLEALDADPTPTDELLETRRLLWKAGRKGLARTLLELLAESQEARGDWPGALAALREMVRLTEKPPADLARRLEDALRQDRAGSPSLDAVLEKYPIASSRRPLKTLEIVERWLDHDLGTVVEVAGQGVGRVVDPNLTLDTIKVDVGTGRPVSVPFGAVTKFVRRLPEASFLYRKVTDPENLRKQVENEPAEALVGLLESLGDPADVASIKAGLEGLLPVKRWTSWWAKARKHPRIVSSGSGSRLRYSVSSSAGDAEESLLETLRTAAPRDRLAVARRLATRGDAGAAAAARALEASLTELETSDPGAAWETAVLLTTLPGGAGPANACRARLLESTPPVALLASIHDRAARVQALEALRETDADGWIAQWAEWLRHEESPPVLGKIAAAVAAGGGDDLLDAALEAIFRNPGDHTAQVVWACEAMTADGAPEPLLRRMTPSLLERIPDMLTRKEYAPYRSRAKALLDGGRVAIRLLLERATPEQARRFSERVARVSILEPQRVRLVEQAVAQIQSRRAREVDHSALLVATQTAVETKRAELKQLLDVEIPRTLKGINAAAAEGDLRENFEYHMLRDRQELLSAKAAKIQSELGRVHILQPGAADTSRVNIGTVVHFEAPDGQPVAPVTILGVWDADVERRVFANGTELAQRLLGRTAGDQVEIEGRSARIARIEAWSPE